jgi:hypothetical protein
MDFVEGFESSLEAISKADEVKAAEMSVNWFSSVRPTDFQGF